MTVKDAYQIIKKNNQDLTLVECVDIGDRFGFVFLKWDEKKYGKPTRETAHRNFVISGWSTVDKKTGKIDELNSYYYLEAHPEMKGKIKQLPIDM